MDYKFNPSFHGDDDVDDFVLINSSSPCHATTTINETPEITLADSAAYGLSQNPTVVSAGAIPSVASSPSDSMQQKHQAPTARKRISKSRVSSPAGVGNMSVPLNANNHSVSMPPLEDKAIRDRLEQIETVAILYSLYQNQADLLAAQFRSLMTHEGLHPQEKQTKTLQQKLENYLQKLQQKKIQRNMLMGLEPGMGMENIGNNISGFGGLGNALGMGTSVGRIGGAGISGPMGAMSGMGGMGQISLSEASNITNAINLQLRTKRITQAQADAMVAKLRMMQNQTNMLGGAQSGITGVTATGQMLGGTQSGITGMTATGQSLHNKASSYMDQQQQQQNILLQQQNILLQQQNILFQQQLQQQQQHLLHQQQQIQHQPQNILLQQQMEQQQQLYPKLQQLHQQKQHQQIGIPLPAVVSSPLVGSPSANQSQVSQQMSPHLQQFGPQKTNQQTAMSPLLSSGSMPQVNNDAANTKVTPGSPRLSSQTPGSVSSIPSSSVELQGMQFH